MRARVRAGDHACLGGCAMALFFVNGFTRYPSPVLAIELNTWFWGLLVGFVSAGFAVILAQIVAGTEKKLCAL